MAATEGSFKNLDVDGVGAFLGNEWPGLVAAVQSLTIYFVGKIAAGAEPDDVLNGIMLGNAGQSVNHKDWRIIADSTNKLLIDENTGTEGAPVWTTRLTVDATGGVAPHAASHKDGGADEVATATPGASQIVKAGVGGTLADGWISASNVTQHQASIDHDLLLNFVANEHLDWTVDQGATNIAKANVPSAGDADTLGGAAATATPTANAVVKALAGATLADGWISASNVTQHQASIDHDLLLNFVANEHLDWTVDQGATNIAKANVPSAGDADTLGAVAAASYARLDVAEEFTAAQGTTESVPAISAGALTLNFDASNLFEVSLTENVTSMTITNTTHPGTRVLKFTQDVTGGRTVAWPAAIKWSGGTAPTVTATANAVDVYTFLVDSAGAIYGAALQDLS